MDTEARALNLLSDLLLLTMLLLLGLFLLLPQLLLGLCELVVDFKLFRRVGRRSAAPTRPQMSLLLSFRVTGFPGLGPDFRQSLLS